MSHRLRRSERTAKETPLPGVLLNNPRPNGNEKRSRRFNLNLRQTNKPPAP